MKIGVASVFARAFAGLPIVAPYRLDDMALDAVALMDALGIRRAHIVGASIGGKIAQIIAAKHSRRASSLVSIRSSSGDPRLPAGSPTAIAALTAARPHKDDGGRRSSSASMSASDRQSEFPNVGGELRTKVERAFDRSYTPDDVARQMIAILASSSRVLKTIRALTLVLHGRKIR
jgi:pimeloyl-ACP methyl ester carboxylesterase